MSLAAAAGVSLCVAAGMKRTREHVTPSTATGSLHFDYQLQQSEFESFNKIPCIAGITSSGLVSASPPLQHIMSCNGSPPGGGGYRGSLSYTGQQQGSSSSNDVLMFEEKELQKEQSMNGFTLYIMDEPEENYRARYESEGCRGPMKGRSGGCPSVMLVTNQCSATILTSEVTVELTSSDGTSLQSCRLDSMEEGQNLHKKLMPGEKIIFDNLRIRRLKKTDTTTSPKGVAMATKKTGGRGKQDEKQAHLLFKAKLTLDNQQIITLKAISAAIYLNANHDPPEIHKVLPNFGTTGDTIAIIGTRMHSPRVTFLYTTHDGRDNEAHADIEKEISHQNALVVKVPQLPVTIYNGSNVISQVKIRVTAGKGDRTGREPLRSNLSDFSYVKQGTHCKECAMASLAPPPPPPTLTQYFQPTSYITMMSSPSVIMSSRPPISPHQTPPPATPTSSVSGHVEVEQILDELCEESGHAHSCIISPTATQHSPYSYPSHTSPVTGRYTPTLIQTQPMVMASEPTNQIKPEEMERYLPRQSIAASSPPLISYSSPINNYSPPYCSAPNYQPPSS